MKIGVTIYVDGHWRFYFFCLHIFLKRDLIYLKGILEGIKIEKDNSTKDKILENAVEYVNKSI